jgi:hypothetical protein
MKVKAVAVGKLHDMRYPPYVRHKTIVVFHFYFSLSVIESVVILSGKGGQTVKMINIRGSFKK